MALKLREDLNKERRHNEITRANIIHEFEQKVSQDTERINDLMLQNSAVSY